MASSRMLLKYGIRPARAVRPFTTTSQVAKDMQSAEMPKKLLKNIVNVQKFHRNVDNCELSRAKSAGPNSLFRAAAWDAPVVARGAAVPAAAVAEF